MSNPGSAQNAVNMLAAGGGGKSLMTLNIGPNGVTGDGEGQPVMPLGGSCEICFIPSTLKCGLCENIYYCSVEHQKQDWRKHKKQCAKRKADKALDKQHFKDVAKELSSTTKESGKKSAHKLQPKAAWSAGFNNTRDKYIWFVNVYSMRVNDDQQWGGISRGLNTRSKALPWVIVMDFIVFAKLALQRDVIPTLDWSWSEFLAIATVLLLSKFTKEDAIKWYGGENIFNVGTGGCICMSSKCTSS